MGQAKIRGDFSERLKQAKDRVESFRPASMDCVHCKEKITEFTDLEPPARVGLDAAFCGLCLHCGLVNYAIFGPEDNVREAYRVLAMDKLNRYKARKPGPIECETCKRPLSDVVELPTEGLPGIASAQAASCNVCHKPTYVIVGEAKAVEGVHQKLQAAGFMGAA